MRLKAFASVFSLYLISIRIKRSLIGVLEQFSKERDTVCAHRDADDLLQIMPSKLDKYVIDKELQHKDNSIFCVAPFVFRFVFTK